MDKRVGKHPQRDVGNAFGCEFSCGDSEHVRTVTEMIREEEEDV